MKLMRFILAVFCFSLLIHYHVALAENFQTLHSGKLIIGTSFTNPPLEFLQNNKKIGFEIDLMDEIAKRLHLQPVYINSVWENIIGQLINNKYDVIMGGITITPNREKVILFTKPYLVTILSILININRTPKIKSLNDLHNQIMGVQAKTTDYDAARKMQEEGKIKSIKVYSFANFNQAVNDLVSGKIGAVMKIFPVANYYTHLYPQLHFLTSTSYYPQPLGFGVNPHNKALLVALNKALAEIKANGAYEKIYEKWFKKCRYC